MNVQTIDLILESTYNAALGNFQSTLMQEATDMDVIAGQRFITESVLSLRTLLVEEGIVQNVKDNLLGYAGAAGLGATGMYAYDKYNQPDVYEQLKQGGNDIINGLTKDGIITNDAQAYAAGQPVIDPATGNVVAEHGSSFVDGLRAHLAESETIQAPVMNIFEEAISMVLPLVMENTSENLKSKMIARVIMENGSINFEEADFLCNLVDQVLTEAVGEFIPDEIEVDDTDMGDMDADPMNGMELFDADGNKYTFDNGTLTPAGGEGILPDDMDGDVDPDDMDGDVDPEGLPDIDGGTPDMDEPSLPINDAGDVVQGDEAPLVPEMGEAPAESDVMPLEGDNPVRSDIDVVVDPDSDGDDDTGAGIDTDADADADAGVNVDADAGVNVDADADNDVDLTAADGITDPEEEAKKKVVEESTQVRGQLLTESSDIVDRILARMKY